MVEDREAAQIEPLPVSIIDKGEAMEQPKRKVSGTTVGHPVDVSSGAVFTAWHDFEFPGFIPFVWRRFYSTLSVETTPLGRGWMTPFFMYLSQEPDKIVLHDDEGQEIDFQAASLRQGEPRINAKSQMELRRTGQYYTVYYWHHEQRYVFEEAEKPGRWRLAWIEDLSGNRLRVQYDGEGRFQSVEQAGLRLIRSEYNDQGYISRLFLMISNVKQFQLAQYEYDDQGRLVTCSDSAGRPLRYEYDEEHRLTRETNRLGGSFRFEYDWEGYCTRCWGDDGYMERRLDYDKINGITRVTNSLGYLTEYHLNQMGLVTTEVWPRGGRTETSYDELARVVSVTYPNGGTIRYEYDDRGDRTAFVDEMGAEFHITFNDLHLPVTLTDPEAFDWRLEYDRRGNLTSVINPEEAKWTLERNDRGLVQATIMAGGRRIERRFDPELRWQESRDQISFMERREYDDRGNEVAVYDAEGLIYQVTYDAVGHHVAINYAEGAVIEYAWDAEGNLIERLGPAGARDRWKYDRFGHLLAHFNTAGQALRLEYNTEAQLTSVINHIDERMRLSYDQDGGLVRQEFFDGRLENYERDLNGVVVRIRRSNGGVIEHKHDLSCRVIERISSDGRRTTLAFGKRGGLVRAENSDTVVEFKRDSVNRVIAEVQNGHRLEYQYDADHNLTVQRLVESGVEEMRIHFDLRGRPARIADARGVIEQIGWDALNRMTERRFGSGAREQRTFGDDRRLARQEVFAPKGDLLVERRYGYDRSGNVIRLEDSLRGSSEFQYDVLNRMVRAHRGSEPEEWYNYDPVGTITASHSGRRAIGPGARTLSAGSITLEYDRNGNVSVVSNGADKIYYEYDNDGQVVEVVTGGKRIRYGYDPMGRRAWKEIDGKRTEYAWNLFDLAAELEDGHVTRRYSSFLMMPLAVWADGQWSSSVSNHLSVPQELLSEKGSLAWQVSLDSYGRVLNEQGQPGSPFRYRGQYHDRDVDHYYNIHRYYLPSLGVYDSPDPIGIQGGVNLYAYSRNPVMWDDPFGLKCGACVTNNSQRQLAPGQTNRGKGVFGESMMDDHMGAHGYVPLHAPNRHQGIDGVYYNPSTGHYVIAESKFGSSQLGRTADSRQMSNTWINGSSSPATGYTPRIDHALQGSSHTSAMVAAAGADKVLVHTDAMGNISLSSLGKYP